MCHFTLNAFSKPTIIQLVRRVHAKRNSNAYRAQLFTSTKSTASVAVIRDGVIARTVRAKYNRRRREDARFQAG